MVSSECPIDRRLMDLYKVMGKTESNVTAKSRHRRNEKRADIANRKRSKIQTVSLPVVDESDESQTEKSSPVSSRKRGQQFMIEDVDNSDVANIGSRRANKPQKRNLRYSKSLRIQRGGADLSGNNPISRGSVKRQIQEPVWMDNVSRSKDTGTSKEDFERLDVTENRQLITMRRDSERTTRQ